MSPRRVGGWDDSDVEPPDRTARGFVAGILLGIAAWLVVLTAIRVWLG